MVTLIAPGYRVDMRKAMANKKAAGANRRPVFRACELIGGQDQAESKSSF
jgi:hypothetical protein